MKPLNRKEASILTCPYINAWCKTDGCIAWEWDQTLELHGDFENLDYMPVLRNVVDGDTPIRGVCNLINRGEIKHG